MPDPVRVKKRKIAGVKAWPGGGYDEPFVRQLAAQGSDFVGGQKRFEKSKRNYDE